MMGEITPRERFLLAFDHTQADRVPIFDTPNNPKLFQRELGTKNYFSEGPNAVRLSKKLGMDACLVPDRFYTGLISKERNWYDSSHFTDEMGVRYRVSEESWPLAMPEEIGMKDRSDWEAVTLPDPHAKWRLEEIRNAVSEAHQGKADDIAVIAGVRSAFSVMYISMGLEELSFKLYDEPDLIREMSDKLCEYWTEVSLSIAETGADAVFIANDMGQNKQTIISPEALRRFFFPQLKKQITKTKEAGLKIIFHSCGNVNAVLEDIVDSGADGLNNIQVAAGMDIGEVKKQYGDELTLLGNVDSTRVMTSSDPTLIEDAVKDTVKAASVGGGHILATDHSFHSGIPLENVDTFLEAAMRFGRYSA